MIFENTFTYTNWTLHSIDCGVAEGPAWSIVHEVQFQGNLNFK